MRLYAVSAAEAAGRNTMRHLLRRTAGALLALFVIAAFAAPHALGALSRPAVEKPPSPEAVNEWESAVFIARANGAALFAWRIVSSDGTALYDAAAAPEYFPGLRVPGRGYRHAHASRHPLLAQRLAGRMPVHRRCRGKSALGTRVAHGLPRRVRPRRRSRRPRRTRLPPRSGLRRWRSLPRRSQPRSPRPRPLPCAGKRPCRRQLPPPPRPRRFRAARCSVCLPVSLRSRSFSARSL